MAAFAASPLVTCHDHGTSMHHGSSKHACGRMCPMHHGQQPSTPAGHEHHHAASTTASVPVEGASMNCRCPLSDAALAALILDVGVLPQTSTIEDFTISTRVVMPDYAAPTHSQNPDTPPPRA
jgi:hypothetical protein